MGRVVPKRRMARAPSGLGWDWSSPAARYLVLPGGAPVRPRGARCLILNPSIGAATYVPGAVAGSATAPFGADASGGALSSCEAV